MRSHMIKYQQLITLRKINSRKSSILSCTGSIVEKAHLIFTVLSVQLDELDKLDKDFSKRSYE